MTLEDVLQTHADGIVHLPEYAFPGGYPIGYVDKYDCLLCATCALKDFQNYLENEPTSYPYTVVVLEEMDTDEDGNCIPATCEQCNVSLD